MSRRSNAAAVAVVEPPRARPIVRWAGGKTWLVDELVSHIGPRILATRKRYFESFAGGAALFWRLQEMSRTTGAVLSDANAELIDMYRAVRDRVDDVIDRLSGMVYDSDCYYRTRAINRISLDLAASAARTIYLNKCCMNGLYRVNKSGGFNVPMGRTSNGKPPKIVDAVNLRACSAALQDVEILHDDFGAILRATANGRPHPEAGDLVFLDEPYLPPPATKGFTGYTSDGWCEAKQEEVAGTFRELAQRGVYVLASNGHTPRVKELYRGFRQIEVARSGSMNSDPTKRGKVAELLILGWERA